MPKARGYHSKKEFAYETLREHIMSGALKPGTRLIIDELSAELGVSPIPVREALQQLQYDGFVTIEPYVGARVSEIHASLIKEIFALLEALETISSTVACQKMSDADFAEMEALLQRMDRDISDLEQWAEDNVQLHQFLCEKASMSLVANVMHQVLDHWNRLRRYYLQDVIGKRVEAAQRDHWRLLEALRTRDPKVVAQVIRTHNQEALSSYLQYLASSGKLEPEEIIHMPGGNLHD